LFVTIEDKTGVDGHKAGSKADGPNGAADHDKMVPLSALEAERKARQKLETELARVSGTVEGLKAGQQQTKVEPEKTFTRAQLRASVAAGDITEDQADDIFEQQLEKKLTARLETKAVKTVQVSEQSRTVQGEIDKYVDAHPDLIVADSELRAKVQGEFDYLVKLGDNPKDTATQLKAIRAAVGPLKAKSRAKSPETFDETGGAGGNEDRSGSDTWAKGLSQAQRKHYEKLVNTGVYKGFNDPKLVSELKFAKKAN
jgi:hypothetical protein